MKRTTIAWLARLGSEPVGNSLEQARQFIRAELAKWAKTEKAAGIKSGQCAIPDTRLSGPARI